MDFGSNAQFSGISDVSDLQVHAGWQMSKSDIFSWHKLLKEKAPAMWAVYSSMYLIYQQNVIIKGIKGTMLVA